MPIPRLRALPASILAALQLSAGLIGCNAQAHKAGGRSDASAHAVDQAADGPARYPSSMDALGGSVTVGFNTDCPDPWVDCPENSWATGTNPAVDSVYVRLLALDPRLEDHNANDAVSGSTMADLDDQARSAVRHQAELVTIAM